MHEINKNAEKFMTIDGVVRGCFHKKSNQIVSLNVIGKYVHVLQDRTAVHTLTKQPTLQSL